MSGDGAGSKPGGEERVGPPRAAKWLVLPSDSISLTHFILHLRLAALVGTHWLNSGIQPLMAFWCELSRGNDDGGI